MVTSASAARAIARASGHLDTRTAAHEVGDFLYDGIAGACDLLVVFASFHHRAALTDAVTDLRRLLGASHVLAVTTEGTIAGREELERTAGFAAMALRLPGAAVHLWTSTPDAPLPLRDPALLRERIGWRDDSRAAMLIGDPFSTPVTRLLPALDLCTGDPAPRPRFFGGMASGASQPWQNVLIADDEVMHSGIVGVTFSGAVAIDVLVSQGCRGVGPSLVITKARQNVILELGGRPALEVLNEVASRLSEPIQALAQRGGLVLGMLADENKRPAGRGDYLVRNILGVSRKPEGIIAGDLARVGRTVQFHLRDQVTAREDLDLLLDGQVLGEKPLACLFFSCRSRGESFYGHLDHDVNLIQDRIGPVPLTGFLAAGEVGPVNGRTFLHGHTAVAAVVRAS